MRPLRASCRLLKNDQVKFGHRSSSVANTKLFNLPKHRKYDGSWARAWKARGTVFGSGSPLIRMARETNSMKMEDEAYLASLGYQSPQPKEMTTGEHRVAEDDANTFPAWMDAAQARPSQYFFRDAPSYKSEEWNLPFKIVVLAEGSRTGRIKGGKMTTFHAISVVGNYSGVAGVGWGAATNTLDARKASIREAWKDLRVHISDQGTVNRSIGAAATRDAMFTVRPSRSLKVSISLVELCRMFGIRGAAVENNMVNTGPIARMVQDNGRVPQLMAVANALSKHQPYFRTAESRGLNTIHAKSPYTDHLSDAARSRGLLALSPAAAAAFDKLNKFHEVLNGGDLPPEAPRYYT